MKFELLAIAIGLVAALPSKQGGPGGGNFVKVGRATVNPSPQQLGAHRNQNAPSTPWGDARASDPSKRGTGISLGQNRNNQKAPEIDTTPYSLSRSNSGSSSENPLSQSRKRKSSEIDTTPYSLSRSNSGSSSENPLTQSRKRKASEIDTTPYSLSRSNSGSPQSSLSQSGNANALNTNPSVKRANSRTDGTNSQEGSAFYSTYTNKEPKAMGPRSATLPKGKSSLFRADSSNSAYTPPLNRAQSTSSLSSLSETLSSDESSSQSSHSRASRPQGPKFSRFKPGTEAYEADQFIGGNGAKAKELKANGHISEPKMLVRTPSEKNIFEYNPKQELSKGAFGKVFNAKNLATGEQTILKNFHQGETIHGYKTDALAAHEHGNLQKLGRNVGGLAKTEKGTFSAQTPSRGITAHKALENGQVSKEQVEVAGNRALDQLHAKGVVHNDPHPKNMILKTRFDGGLDRTNSGKLKADWIDYGGMTPIGKAIDLDNYGKSGITLQKPVFQKYKNEFGENKPFGPDNHGQMDKQIFNDFLSGNTPYER